MSTEYQPKRIKLEILKSDGKQNNKKIVKLMPFDPQNSKGMSVYYCFFLMQKLDRYKDNGLLICIKSCQNVNKGYSCHQDTSPELFHSSGPVPAIVFINKILPCLFAGPEIKTEVQVCKILNPSRLSGKERKSCKFEILYNIMICRFT